MTSTPSSTRSPSPRHIVTARSAVVLAVIIAVVLAGLAAAVGVASVGLAHDKRVDTNRTELRRVAGPIVAQVFSVRRSSWQADRTRARAVVGGEFAYSYATVLAGPPAAGIDAITWTPDGVGLVSVGTSSGDALVHALVDTVDTVDGQHHSERQSVQARFERTGGRWLLTRLDALS